MLRSPFFRRLFIPYLMLIVAVSTVVGVVGARIVGSAYLDRQRIALHDSALLAGQALAVPLGKDNPAELALRVKQIARDIECRVTVMRSDGVVIADSEADPATMENHRQRPEFVAAMQQGEGTDDRASSTVHSPFLYLARPLIDAAGAAAQGADGQSCYIRLAAPMEPLRDHLRLFYAAISTAAGASILIGGFISFVFARRHAEPMVDLTHFADALARGELHRRTLRPEKTGEVAMLASSLNTMADSLQHLVVQTTRDKAELLAILSSMSEGVIATDASQHIVLVNDAAGRLLGFDPASAAGKCLWEVVRNEQIIKAAGEVLSSAQRKLINVGPVSARHLDVTLCTFGPGAPSVGLIIVAHDITQSFQYQELRKEFVANVSHELRTPLTVIKGFVETLLDGAWRDEAKAPEYLAVIARHTNQLTNLVSDLLELSRIESQGLVPGRAPVEIALVVRRAIELLGPATQRKNQSLTLECAPDLPVIQGNADYLERAVANLVDNASKYTPEGGRIVVRCRRDGAVIVVEVEDNGLGIPANDIPRIFERFYRVDRSRSREMGGTGLGLSIVKHVAQVHGGTVEVESTPTKGSTFRLRIPAAA